MKDMIKKVPVPLCEIMLGFAALGNLLQSYGEGIRSVCGIVAAFLLILIFAKLLLFPQMIKEDMKNPIMASVAGTFPMALMLLSTYVKPYIGAAAMYIWFFAIALHIVLIVYFTVKFVLKLQLPKVFASYYIVYVGIAVAAVTAPAYEQLGIGTAAFWFGFVTLIILLGNLMKECGVVERIKKTAGNELMNIITIFLGFSVGCTTNAATFLNIQTVEIIVLGIVAFGVGTAGGVLLGKVMCVVTHGKINPLIGSAGVSAVPMAARVSQKVGQEYNPRNYLLMHAMGPNWCL